MHDFLLKELHNIDIKKEIETIGFDKTYSNKAVSKFEYKNFKIFNLNCAQANIIKQTALTVGADCATHREVITGKIEKSSVILGGSISQLIKIAKKLEHQPFGLKELGKLILKNCEPALKDIKILNQVQNDGKVEVQNDDKVPIQKDRVYRTKIMGILNLTENSFSDGGKYYETTDAVKHLNQLIEDGADIIDIGAESTKPFSTSVSAEHQLEKLIPVLKYIKSNNIKIPISIDTRSAKVALKCIELGANIINDVSGFDFDSKMVNVLAGNPDIKIIIQHSKGTPETMQISPVYENLMDEIFINLKSKVDFAISQGIKKENIIIDPGIGFGKTKADNLEIIKRWRELKTIGCPILLGLSRKSLLDMPQAQNSDKDLYTLVLNSILINENIDYIRVHNVKIHKNFQNILG